jgi:hypothetical protein
LIDRFDNRRVLSKSVFSLQQWANYQKVNNSCAMAHRPTSGPYKRIYGENIAWNGGFKSSATQVNTAHSFHLSLEVNVASFR